MLFFSLRRADTCMKTPDRPLLHPHGCAAHCMGFLKKQTSAPLPTCPNAAFKTDTMKQFLKIPQNDAITTARIAEVMRQGFPQYQVTVNGPDIIIDKDKYVYGYLNVQTDSEKKLTIVRYGTKARSFLWMVLAWIYYFKKKGFLSEMEQVLYRELEYFPDKQKLTEWKGHMNYMAMVSGVITLFFMLQCVLYPMLRHWGISFSVHIPFHVSLYIPYILWGIYGIGLYNRNLNLKYSQCGLQVITCSALAIMMDFLPTASFGYFLIYPVLSFLFLAIILRASLNFHEALNTGPSHFIRNLGLLFGVCYTIADLSGYSCRLFHYLTDSAFMQSATLALCNDLTFLAKQLVKVVTFALLTYALLKSGGYLPQRLHWKQIVYRLKE